MVPDRMWLFMRDSINIIYRDIVFDYNGKMEQDELNYIIVNLESKLFSYPKL